VARGQLRDFERYAANVGIPYDSIKNELFPPLNYHGGDDYEEKDRPRREYINKSLLCTALGSYIYNAIDEKRLLLLLNLFLRKFGYSQENILHGMEVTIDYRITYDTLKMHKAVCIIKILAQDLDFDLLSCQNVSWQLGRKIVEEVKHEKSYKNPEMQRSVDVAKADLLECKCLHVMEKMLACLQTVHTRSSLFHLE